MADNMTFPMHFDLEKGVNDAIKDWNDKYADKLEKAIQKRALNVKLKFDTKAFDNLDDVKRRLAELKITPLTPENKTAIRDLVRELKELARIMEKIQKFKGIELPELQMAKAAKLRKDVAQADEKLRLSQERLILSQQRAARQADRTSKAYSAQSGYLERLIKKMAIYASFSMVGNFLTSVREVTAQFELQRVSLGAILQDANKGEHIFSQIKQFALNSPLSILDMTRYTKQLAAYKIEYDELFEMTKRFADISVGLGVDYQRIVLAAGQTRTATYLRASELKQFTELGVPLLEELSIKLSKMNGEMVSTAEVMDMISKRAISWELVKEVLYDMTDAGGMFYNMQIQQGNTLYGLWQKLGDAASVMYEQIGNTGWVNSGMKEAIQLLTELMRNWKAVGLTAVTTILPAVAAMRAMKMATTSLAKAVNAATNERIIAEAKLATAMKGTDIAAQNAARSTLAKAKADEAAAIAAQKHTTALGKLKMGLVSLGKSIAAGLGIGIAITLITQLIYKISEAITNFRKLENELGSIYSQTATLQDQSVRNFEFLADKAVKAANGSKEQKDALEELNRTYKDILPQESLTIENLSRMKDGYDELTQSIKEYIAEQQRQKAESAIFEYYGTKIRDAQNDVRERLYDQGLSATEVGRFFAAFEKLAPQAGKSTYQKFREAMLKAGVDDTKLIAKIWKKEFEFTQRDIFGSDTGFANITALTEAYADQADEIRGMNEEYREATGQLGEFDKKIKQTKESLQNTTYRYSDGRAVDANTFLYQQMQANAAMKRVRDLILNDEDMKKAIQEKAVELQPEWLHLVDSVNPNDLMDITKVNFDAIIKAVGDKYPDLAMRLKALQKEWGNVIPADSKVQLAREKGYQIVTDAHGNIDKMSRFLMQSGEDWKIYVTRIKDEMESEKQKLKELRQEREKTAKWGLLARLMNPLADIKIDESEKKLEQLTTLFNTFKEFYDPDEKKNKGGAKSDPRLQNLKEEISLTKKLYDEYHKLEKQIGATKAAEKIQEIYSNTIKTLRGRAGKYGFKFELPFTDENLKANMQHFIDKMKALQRLRDKKGKPLFPNIGKEIDEAVAQLEDVDLNSLQKALEKKLKELADRISRTKTAKEFYEKILGQTGNKDMAARLATSIFGENGEELNREIADRMRKMVEGTSAVLPDMVFHADMSVNAKALRGWVEANKDALGDVAKELTKFADESEKDTAKMVEGWLKATEKAKSASDKLLDLARTTRTEIDRIESERSKGDITDEYAKAQTEAYRQKLAQEAAKLEYEMFKDSPMYVQMFDDLDHASTRMLENMKKRMEDLQGEWKNLDPTQLKEMQSRLNEIDAQLARRNPFSTLAKAIRDYRKLLREGDERGNRSAKDADKDLIETARVADEARKKYDELVKKYGKGSEKSVQEVIDAKGELDRAMADEEAAQKAVENWKKVKDMIGLSANELFQMLNWAGDIAHAVADISEAMGADEEDVQYWNDVADALGNIAGGIQDIVSAAMSGNVTGIISSTLTAIPKMFVGFANLFAAGKVKRANKEIKRQQELLEQLEYTYGRLEKAAERAFGGDYISNYNQRMRVLRAEQEAYLKQAEAERSKGKKEDEAKTQEYMNRARDAADQIAEMQSQIAEQMTGTDVGSAAREFAQAWLEAEASFSSTSSALKEKFDDMIKSMVVESVMAKVVSDAMQPMFDEMNEMYKRGESMTSVLAYAMRRSSELASELDAGLRTAAAEVEAAGVSIRGLYNGGDGLKGISRDIATASEESITGLAQGVNTQNYYLSHVPQLAQNVAAMRAMMEAAVVRGGGGTGVGGVDYTGLSAEAMGHLAAIERHTAETVAECRNIAARCEEEVGLLRRVIVPKGQRGAHGVQVWM